jgi:hypothetical protein
LGRTLIFNNKRGRLSSFVLILLVFASLFCLISGVYGRSETVTVAPYGDMKRTVNLSQGDSVSGTLTPTTSGYMANMGSLTVIAPDKSLLVNSVVTDNKQIPFSFSAHVSGTYTITFWNINLLQSARVTLDYTVQSSDIQFSEFLVTNKTSIIIIIVIFGIVLTLVTTVILQLKLRKPVVSRNIIPIPPNQPVKNELVDEIKQIPINKSIIECGECGTFNDIDAVFCKKCANRFR